MKNQVKAVSLILALVLLLSLLPIGALAEEHVHYYTATQYGNPHYEYYNNSLHTKVTTYRSVCSCGDVYYNDVYGDRSSHVRKGSGTYIGTSLGSNGENVPIYQYICPTCNHSFTVT